MPGRRPAPVRVRAGRTEGRRARLPGLDGLRGIGIAAVIVFHLNPSWLPGGYLGVDIFFVVSGFLITGLLLDLFAGPARPALRQFWARRARRLLPGLVVLLIAVAIAAGFVAKDAVPELRADIPAALAFVANWRLLFHHDNYFQAIGRPPLLQHLWSLGVEEQFYLIWPFVVLFFARLARRPTKALAIAASVGAVGSAVLMAALFVPGLPSGVYYDTFTHASGLLIGSALAAATRGRRADLGGLARKRRAQVGAAAAAGLVALLAVLGSGGTFAYRGGIFLASALTGLVLLICLQPGPVQRFLCLRPLRYLGTRSYSLYLWHWPVICLTRPDIDIRLSGAPLLLVRLFLMGGAAEASYRLVEQPWRTGRAQAALRALKRPGRTAALGSVGACGATAVVLLAVINPPPLSAALLAGSTPQARIQLTPTTTRGVTQTTTARGVVGPRTNAAKTTPARSTAVPSGTARTTSPTTTPVTSQASSSATSSPAPPSQGAKTGPSTSPHRPSGRATKPPATSQPSGLTQAAERSVAHSGLGHPYLALGDSVLLAASTALEDRMHDEIVVDATVGRQVWSGINRLAEYRAAGDLNGLKGLVIDLGTNGPMYPDDVLRLRQLATGVPLLVFVNVRVPRPWQSTTNASIAGVAGQPGIRVVNWYSASSARGLLWADGVHPDPQGQVIYANLVAHALAPARARGANGA